MPKNNDSSTQMGEFQELPEHSRIPERSDGAIEFESVEDFLNWNEGVQGGVRVWYGGLPIDFDVNLVPGAPLFTTFHGAALSEPRLPWFVGYGIASGIKVSSVKFSDPSLYLDETLRLAWFAGNKKQPELQLQLHKLIGHLSELGKAQSLIFFGGSGGGYAALEAASSFEDSVAIVFNPQTIISEYNPDAVAKFERVCWEGALDPRATFNLVEKFKADSTNCTVLYLQNSTDTPHVERHLKPLLDVIEPRHDFLLLTEDWGKGHKPPPKEILQKVLKSVVESNDEFSLIKLGFEKIGDKSLVTQSVGTAKRGSLAYFLINSRQPSLNIDTSVKSVPTREQYLQHFDFAAGRSWKIEALDLGKYIIEMPSKQEVKISVDALQTLDFWDATFESQNSTNKLWLRSCWYAAEIARAGDVEFAMEILSSYRRWLESNDLSPQKLAINSFDHCLALNLRTCAWLLVVPDLTPVQSEGVKALVNDLQKIAVRYDRFLGNNHGIMLALSIIHSSAASGVMPPRTHSLERIAEFLFAVFDSAVSPKGLVRENTSIYQFLWVKWAWEVAHTFEYVLNERALAMNFVQRAEKIADTAALFGINARSTLPLGDGGRRSAPVYGPRKGVLDGADDGLFILNDGEGNVFSYSAGSRTAVHRHVDEHTLRLYLDGQELIADAGMNSYDIKDPVSRCVTSQRGHSGLFFPQFDYLPGSAFYPSDDPLKRSYGSLRVFEATEATARLGSYRVVDEKFATQRFVEFDGLSRKIEVRDYAHAPVAQSEKGPVARFLIPSELSPSKENDLRFEGNGAFIDFSLDSKSLYEVFQGRTEWTNASDELYGVICPRPGQPERAWVLEVELNQAGDSIWTNRLLIQFGKVAENAVQ